MSTIYTVVLKLEDEFDERENLDMLESDVTDAIDNIGLRILSVNATKDTYE